MKMTGTPEAYREVMTNRPEISTMLTLSTAHISGATAQALNVSAKDPKGGIAPVTKWHVYGWIVWRDDDIDTKRYPDLAACFALAREHRAAWVRFDTDTTEIEALPTYEWTECDVCGGVDQGNTCCP